MSCSSNEVLSSRKTECETYENLFYLKKKNSRCVGLQFALKSFSQTVKSNKQKLYYFRISKVMEKDERVSPKISFFVISNVEQEHIISGWCREPNIHIKLNP